MKWWQNTDPLLRESDTDRKYSFRVVYQCNPSQPTERSWRVRTWWGNELLDECGESKEAVRSRLRGRLLALLSQSIEVEVIELDDAQLALRSDQKNRSHNDYTSAAK